MSFSLLSFDNERTLLKNNKYFIVQAVLFSVTSVLGYYFIGDPLALVIICSAIVCLATVYSFYLAFSMLIFCILFPAMSFMHLSVLYTPFLLISFLISYKGNLRESLKFPVLPSIIMYIVSCIPSLFNTPQILLSVRDSYNLIGFIIVLICTSAAIRTHRSILRVFYAFIGGVFIHSLIVIIMAVLSGKRVFGLLDVFYVDFAGLAAMYSIILFFYSKKGGRILWIFLFGIIVLGLILTQTRNAWLSTSVAIFTFLVFMLFKSSRFKINKNTVLFTFIALTFIVITTYFSVAALNPKIGERFELQESNTDASEVSSIFSHNSLASRGLIWYTCYNAFNTHPFLGIGVYAFRYTSSSYSTLPDELYTLFVEGRTPHQTFVEVLTETGLFGMVFFLYFLYSLTRFFLKCLKLEQSKEDGLRTLLISWTFVYIMFSMLMTEAWLYGQFLIWFGLVLGLSSSNYILLNLKTEKQNNDG